MREDISRCIDINQIIRVLCIDNLTVGNIKSKVYDKIKSAFLTVYGNQESFLFNNLEELKILQRKPERKYYEYIEDKLQLINLDVSTVNPNDTSYVFGGFCPISIKICLNNYILLLYMRGNIVIYV